MSDLYSTAQSLVLTLNAPPQAHSVWIREEVMTNEEGKPFATGKQQLCVSIRPAWKNRIKVPEVYEGVPVVNVPWPKKKGD